MEETELSDTKVHFLRARSLPGELVRSLSERVRSGMYANGEKLPTQVDLVKEFGVSRTVVREAISYLQAEGLVETRHGIGTFVRLAHDGTQIRIASEEVATLLDAIAQLELRIGIEVEAAALAAKRRTEKNLDAMAQALAAYDAAVSSRGDSSGADFLFHLEIAKATQNVHFASVLQSFGVGVIPRARIEQGRETFDESRVAYLRKVQSEHEFIADAIRNGDPDAARAGMRTHLSTSRERLRKRDAAARDRASNGDI